MANKKGKKLKKIRGRVPKTKVSVSRKVSANEVAKLLEDKYPGSVIQAQRLYNLYDLRRPSGIPSLDVATGGGLPAGGLSQITGPDSVGKNYLMYRYMASCQKIYGENSAIAIACFEPTMDKDFARKAGVQLAYSDYEIALINKRRKKEGQKPLSNDDIASMKKQMGTFLIMRGLPETVLDQVLFVLKSNTFHVIGIDSWDAMLPAEDQEKKMTDTQKMADGPRIESRFFRKFWAVLNSKDDDGEENSTTVIGIRQVRANMSMWGREWKSVGSHAMKHAKLIDIELSQRRKLKRKEGSKDIQIGKTVAWRLAKGKMGCHEGLSGEYDFYFGPPHVDIEKDLVNTAILHGIILQTGAWLSYGDVKAQGIDKMKRAIKDMNLNDQLFNEVKKAVGLQFRWS